MNFEEILIDIKESFQGIWRTKVRGNSLEIITPYATTNNRFISVFLTKQGEDYFISDGGWINSGVYDVAISEDICFLKVFYHYQNTFNVQEIESKDGVVYFYVKVNHYVDVPSKLFDIASFIQTIVSISEIQFESKVEKETRELFVSKANEYLRSFINPDRIKFNRPIDPNRKEIKFNAIFSKSATDLALINYVTGSSLSYFSNSIFRTNTLYEMAEETLYSQFIADKITVVDTDAAGFKPEKISQYLLHLENHTGSRLVKWNERERLFAMLV